MNTKRVLIAMAFVSATAVAQDTVPAEPVAKAVTSQAAQRRPAAENAPAAGAQSGAKTLSGMSILGNQEAPKSLVIVPWKSSRIGDSLGLARNLDDSRQPVDREVFMRELAYYEIRVE